jgi:hypothetical protein
VFKILDIFISAITNFFMSMHFCPQLAMDTLKYQRQQKRCQKHGEKTTRHTKSIGRTLINLTISRVCTSRRQVHRRLRSACEFCWWINR